MSTRTKSLPTFLFVALSVVSVESLAARWRCLHPTVDWISGEGDTKMKAWDKFYRNYHKGFRQAQERRDWRKIDWYVNDKNTKGDPRCRQLR
jgi:hypothetical protein